MPHNGHRNDVHLEPDQVVPAEHPLRRLVAVCRAALRIFTIILV